MAVSIRTMCRAVTIFVCAACGIQRAAVASDETPQPSAAKFGVYEVELSGDGSVVNPFDTIATVTFLPPSGAANIKSVKAFYDGGDTWRARVYVDVAGNWTWTSACPADTRLDARRGSFTVTDSNLRGRLLPHPKNPHHWITEDGRWFLNLSDTAYFLLSTHDGTGRPISSEDFSSYLRDVAAQGITSVRCFLSSGPEEFHGADNSELHRWYDIFTDESHSQLRLDALQHTDRRLQSLLAEFPDMYVQLILLPLGNRYGRDDTFWKRRSLGEKERLLRNLVARYAAFPQIFWLIANDMHYGDAFPGNNALAREVGAYFQQHDPWRHPLSAGHARKVPFFFSDEPWATYIHLEDEADLAAEKCQLYQHLGKPIFLGEDRYEQDHGPVRDPSDMRYFQRRLFWSWLLSGGSANYGGRWWSLDPYSETGNRPAAGPPFRKNAPQFTTRLTGLDSVRFVAQYFADRQIDLPEYQPDHQLVSAPDSPTATGLKLMRRATDEFLVYHPNAGSDGKDSTVDSRRTARLRIDASRAAGEFAVEWYRAHDGVSQPGDMVTGGRQVDLTAPWSGCDVVLRLTRRDRQ